MLRQNVRQAPQCQTWYAGSKQISIQVGGQLWLLIKIFWTTRQMKKHNYKRTGPFTVSKIIHKNANQLVLPNTITNHNGFHRLLLGRYAPLVER